MMHIRPQFSDRLAKFTVQHSVCVCVCVCASVYAQVQVCTHMC